MIELFTPLGSTVSVTPTTTTGALALTSLGNTGGNSVRVANLTDKTVFITFGESDAAGVVATSMPVGVDGVETFELSTKVTHVGHIIASGTATGSIYFTSGQGA